MIKISYAPPTEIVAPLLIGSNLLSVGAPLFDSINALLDSGDWAYLQVKSAEGVEVIKAISVIAPNKLAVIRRIDGTKERNFPIGAIVSPAETPHLLSDSVTVAPLHITGLGAIACDTSTHLRAVLPTVDAGTIDTGIDGTKLVIGRKENAYGCCPDNSEPASLDGFRGDYIDVPPPPIPVVAYLAYQLTRNSTNQLTIGYARWKDGVITKYATKEYAAYANWRSRRSLINPTTLIAIVGFDNFNAGPDQVSGAKAFEFNGTATLNEVHNWRLDYTRQYDQYLSIATIGTNRCVVCVTGNDTDVTYLKVLDYSSSTGFTEIASYSLGSVFNVQIVRDGTDRFFVMTQYFTHTVQHFTYSGGVITLDDTFTSNRMMGDIHWDNTYLYTNAGHILGYASGAFVPIIDRAGWPLWGLVLSVVAVPMPDGGIAYISKEFDLSQIGAGRANVLNVFRFDGAAITLDNTLILPKACDWLESDGIHHFYAGVANPPVTDAPTYATTYDPLQSSALYINPDTYELSRIGSVVYPIPALPVPEYSLTSVISQMVEVV